MQQQCIFKFFYDLKLCQEIRKQLPNWVQENPFCVPESVPKN